MRIYKEIEQRSPEWFDLKIGKITGTRVSKVCKPDNLPLIDELIAESVTGEQKQIYVNDKMQRGIDLEPIAIEQYEISTGNQVDQIGFVTSSKYDWLGLSPDGLIRKNGKYIKGVEIKCPDTDTHVRYIRQNKLPAEYRHQIINYFLVCDDLESVDFVSFDPRFSIKPIHVITVYRKFLQDDIDQVEIELVKFMEKFEKYYQAVTQTF
jgi:hypothetical protein